MFIRQALTECEGERDIDVTGFSVGHFFFLSSLYFEILLTLCLTFFIWYFGGNRVINLAISILFHPLWFVAAAIILIYNAFTS